jgi:hypothetical protein
VGKKDKRRYDNQGRDQINIEHVDKVLLQSQEIVRPSKKKELLEEVRKQVEARLAGQLHHAVRLKLQKELQPKQVRPWSMKVKVAIKQPNQLLSTDTTIEQVFDRCSGRLLILGEPGAGKTTSLLDLTLELVKRAEANSQARVPVIVDLSDWQPTPPQTNSVWNKISIRFPWADRKGSEPDTLPVWSISDWLVVKVQETYKFQPKIIKKLLAKRRLIPLLDGLDEVRPEYQQDCVLAIKQWLNSDLCPREVAICCRREQYEAYSEKLELDVGGAVYLQDLTDEQIQLFLNDANRPELWASLAADDNLLELIRRPLLLSMAVLAYGEIDRTQWRQATLGGERINILLDAYVRQMLTQDKRSRAYRNGKIPSFEQSQRWLEVLALQLLQDSETDFLIENMQPRWLSTHFQKCLYILSVGIIFGLFAGALIIFDRSTNIGIVAIIGLIALLMEYLSLEHQNSISPPGLMQISFSNLLKRELWHKLWRVGGWSIVIMPLIAAIFSIGNGLISTLFSIIIFTSCWSLILIIFLSSEPKLEKSYPLNRGIHNSIKNTIFTTLSCASVFTAFCYGITSFVLNTFDESQFFLSVIFPDILIVLLIFGILSGGNSVFIRHYILRLILFLNGSTPGRYVRFLDYSTERLLLQRVNGRYRFTHDLLKQYLAQLRINKYPQLITSRTFARCGESYYLSGNVSIKAGKSGGCQKSKNLV